MAKDTLEELQAQRRKANEAIGRIEDKRRYEENAPLVGKMFKYRNSYSCPEKPSYRWWLYAKVTRVDARGHVYSFQFETDKYGWIAIKGKQHSYHMGNGDGWTEISGAEYRRALKALKSKIAKF